jgi:ABC-type transport system substrate-binding protein
MTFPRRHLPALVLAALVAAACGTAPAPSITPTPVPARTPAAIPSPPAERPFKEVAWPAGGSRCDAPGAAASGVRLGRIEALDARTVRFSLCAPDAAFPARLADPVAGVVDAATVDAVAADPSRARFAAGAGHYRVEAWYPGDNVRLVRAAEEPGAKGDDTVATIVLRWSADAAARTGSLREGTVDVIDGVGATDLEDMSTMPELVAVEREGMSTAYLGFGYGPDFAPVAVRRAFGQGLDRAALTTAAFPPGSTVASHVTPCVVPLGCAGPAWYETNAPAAAAALEAVGFDRKVTYPLYVPSEPVPGLPDPAALAEAVRAQAEERLGVSLEVTPMAPGEIATALGDRRLRGLYLAGLQSRLADPSGYLDPLFGPRAASATAGRAGNATAALVTAATTTNVDRRTNAFADANTEVRSEVPIIPIAHAGSMMALRDDVQGAAASPLHVESLGRFVPGDRSQLVLMQAAEPASTWCAVASTAAERRLCGLVVPGLLVFRPGTLETAPGLATRCTPDARATTWTCRLRADDRFTSGAKVDAGDVVASFAAQADPASDLRAALPPAAFAAWGALFGAAPGTEPQPTAVPSATPGVTPAATPGVTPAASAAATPGASLAPSDAPGATPDPVPSPTASP